MKKSLSFIVLGAALALSGCSGTDAAPVSTVESAPVEEAPQAQDLTGEWRHSNSGSQTNYLVASITNDTISVDWVLDAADMPILDDDGDGSVTAVYWVGSFTAPTDATEPYIWSSQRDAAALETALMGSSEDAKEFTYEDGILSFPVSIQGQFATVEMKQE